MRSVRGYPIEAVLLLSNSNIEGTSRKEAMKLKSSLVVLSGGSPRFATVEYPDLNRFFCVQ